MERWQTPSLSPADHHPGDSIAGVLNGLDALIFDRLAFAVSPALLKHGQRSIGAPLVSRRMDYRRPGRRPSVLDGDRSRRSRLPRPVYSFVRLPDSLDLRARPSGISRSFFMQHVILPLFAVYQRTVRRSRPELRDQWFSHAFFVGSPIALEGSCLTS